ncbi:hypothetical protein M7I_3034 [Glarea lozoyensis 74030]|uniref:Uncharacterized protein n=1 Tax=Glarea lozoyensis (strain ATCC 74030 / MF5533) TaxID=1104152 RepID=H0EKD7_GLAL7|nr:hypothetical protein M7I_3034 [Glarea lozoyensis 74030]
MPGPESKGVLFRLTANPRTFIDEIRRPPNPVKESIIGAKEANDPMILAIKANSTKLSAILSALAPRPNVRVIDAAGSHTTLMFASVVVLEIFFRMLD